MKEAVRSTQAMCYWTPPRVVLWTVLMILGLLWGGRNWLDGFRPAPDVYRDFAQEWLSARNWLAGRPVYSPQVESLVFHTGSGPLRAEDMLPWNAHPPASVLLALPLARLDHRDAHMAWNLAMVPLFLVSLLIVLRESRVPWHNAGLFPAVALISACLPLMKHFSKAQLSIVLLFLIVLAWALSRRERHFLAGSCVGLAASIKLFPAYLLLFWLRSGRRRGLLGGLVAFCLANLATMAILGSDAYVTYVKEVIPSNVSYRSSWANVSVPSLWMRLFDPGWPNDAVPLVHSARIAGGLALLSEALIALFTIRRCLAAETIEQRDWALALAVVGMLLASPTTWASYFLLLVIPLTMIWRAPLSRPQRVWFYFALFVIWVPLQFFMFIPMGSEVTKAWVNPKHHLPPAHPWQTLVSLSVPTYALLILFYLAWRCFPESPVSQITETGQPAASGTR